MFLAAVLLNMVNASGPVYLAGCCRAEAVAECPHGARDICGRVLAPMGSGGQLPGGFPRCMLWTLLDVRGVLHIVWGLWGWASV